MKVEYDPLVDALYVQLSDKPFAYTENISLRRDYERGVDYAEDGTPIGVEFLNVSHGVDLTDVPRADEIAKALAERGIRVLV